MGLEGRGRPNPRQLTILEQYMLDKIQQELNHAFRHASIIGHHRCPQCTDDRYVTRDPDHPIYKA